jgi:hypothetical protein
MEPVPEIGKVAAVLKCPKCGGSQLEGPPALVPAVNPHAFTRDPQPLAANPDPHIRCVNCDSRWQLDDLDSASPRFAQLRDGHAKANAEMQRQRDAASARPPTPR